jgi:hypothetical protein
MNSMAFLAFDRTPAGRAIELCRLPQARIMNRKRGVGATFRSVSYLAFQSMTERLPLGWQQEVHVTLVVQS